MEFAMIFKDFAATNVAQVFGMVFMTVCVVVIVYYLFKDLIFPIIKGKKK